MVFAVPLPTPWPSSALVGTCKPNGIQPLASPVMTRPAAALALKPSKPELKDAYAGYKSAIIDLGLLSSQSRNRKWPRDVDCAPRPFRQVKCRLVCVNLEQSSDLADKLPVYPFKDAKGGQNGLSLVPRRLLDGQETRT
jgi:hypothetical protein